MALLWTPMAVEAQQVDLWVTDQLVRVWDTAGTGGAKSAGFWQPTIASGSYYPFAHHAQSDEGVANTGGMVVAAGPIPPGSPLRHPFGFVPIWDDTGSGVPRSITVWRPIPHEGYKCLGHVISDDSQPPSTSVVCVADALVVPGRVGDLIWDSQDTDFDDDASAWDIDCPEAIDIGGFIGIQSHGQPTEPVYCLRTSAVTTGPAPTTADLESAIAQFGPIINFHPSDPFLPDDPAVILDDASTSLDWMTVENESDNPGLLINSLGSGSTSSATILADIQGALSHPQATEPNFRSLISYPAGFGTTMQPLSLGNLNRAKAYVRAQPYQGPIVELQFWIFYPWNGAGKARLKVSGAFLYDINPTDTLGRHYSDWELVKVRVTKRVVGTPTSQWDLLSVALSRHSGEEEVGQSDPRMDWSNGIYSAIDSHAHYLSAGGPHEYLRVKSIPLPPYCDEGPINFCVATLEIDAYDLTGNGPTLNTRQADKHTLVSSAWPNVETTSPDWLFLTGKWGGYLLNEHDYDVVCMDPVIPDVCVEIEIEKRVGSGKSGIYDRKEWNVACPENANLGALRPSVGTLFPPFSPDVTSYQVILDPAVTDLTLTSLPADHTALVEVTDDSLNGLFLPLPSGPLLGKASFPFLLNPGNNNTIDVRVTTLGADKLPQALDTSGLVWTTGGDARWSGAGFAPSQDIATSGAILDSQTSWIETTIPAISSAGTLRYNWQVSSEPDSDFLRFYVNGILNDEYSGESSAQAAWSFPAGGPYTLRWSYEKNVSVSTGSDRALVDQVVFDAAGVANTGPDCAQTQKTYHLDVLRVATGVVWNANDSGPGSLRQQIADSIPGDVIVFDASLSGQTISLTTLASIPGVGAGLLLIDKNLTIDASSLPGGVTISGSDYAGFAPVITVDSTYGVEVEIDGLTITGGDAGGVVNSQGSTLTCRNCTIFGNTAYYGGGVSNAGTLTLINTTVSGNSAVYGGGLDNDGSSPFPAGATLINTTISNNDASISGGGIYNYFILLNIENSIVAGNTAASDGPDINNDIGLVVAAGANLIGDNDTVCCSASAEFPPGPLVGTPASPLDPLLGPLADNGGPTSTMLPLYGSPAIDAALATANSPATDQRGVSRPVGSADELGAAEQPGFVSVDFSDGGSLLQAGFVAQGNSDAVYSSGIAVVTVDVPTTGFDIFTRSYSPLSSVGSSSVAEGADIGKLAADHFLHIDPDASIDITLSGLASGPHVFDGWWSDVEQGVGFAFQRLEYSTDGGSSFSTVSDAIDPAGLNASPVSFPFVADGVQDVVIRVTENNDFDQLRLNAVAVRYLPEPGFMWQLGSGLGLLGLLHRQRCRAARGSRRAVRAGSRVRADAPAGSQS